MSLRILIGADLVPTQSNASLFASGDVDQLIDAPLRATLDSADYRIFNLEVPLTDVASPIDKCGPALIAPQNTVSGIQKIGTNLAALANNHILDQGEQGLVSTLQTLSGAGIAYVGAGNNPAQAQKPYIIEKTASKSGSMPARNMNFRLPPVNPPEPIRLTRWKVWIISQS